MVKSGSFYAISRDDAEDSFRLSRGPSVIRDPGQAPIVCFAALIGTSTNLHKAQKHRIADEGVCFASRHQPQLIELTVGLHLITCYGGGTCSATPWPTQGVTCTLCRIARRTACCRRGSCRRCSI